VERTDGEKSERVVAIMQQAADAAAEHADRIAAIVQPRVNESATIAQLREELARLRRATRTRPDYDLHCQTCGAPHWLDTSIPSEVWNQIAPDVSLLCLLCIDERMAAAGLSAEAEFYFVGAALRGKLYGPTDLGGGPPLMCEHADPNVCGACLRRWWNQAPPVPAREQELRKEIKGLREANRRLQQQGPALERDKLVKALRKEIETLQGEVRHLKNQLAARPVDLPVISPPFSIEATGVDLKSGRGKATIAKATPHVDKIWKGLEQATGQPCIHGAIFGRCRGLGCRPA
jgi:hypothetical protein